MSSIKFFRVGGCVRDEILGIKSKDIDFAVEAPSFEAMRQAVEARCSKVFYDNDGEPVGGKFFTMRGIDPDFGPVDFVLCRKDGPSTDGRRPDFVEPGTLLEDLARRDFTVNAMAFSEDGSLIDPHGGQEDLDKMLLRFVGNPSERLMEDALRAFRAIRFSITKGFTMTRETDIAIVKMVNSHFTAVSTERMRDELMKCFALSTGGTLNMLVNDFPNILNIALARGIWLKPTTEEP